MILIVDDKPENIFALKKLLELNNFDVDTALSGEEALKKVLKHSYSLIILDVQMPGMDGFEVAEALSGFSRAKDIPVIFLSAANTDKKFITKGYSSGGIDYVAKPIDPDVLMLKVKTFHRLFEQARELNEIHMALREEIEVRKSTQYEQYRKTQELKSILETIPQIAFTLNAKGGIEFVNEQWYVYSEYKNVFPKVYDKDVHVPGFWQNTFAAQQQLPLEVCIRKLYNNESRYHMLSMIPVKEGHEIIKWVGTLTDIHEQRLVTDLLEKQVEKRTEQLIIANEILIFQNEEKEKRASELAIANKELVFQNEEKEKRADELIVANLQLAHQSKEKEKRADELIVANLQLAHQSKEKEKRADELIIANLELAHQSKEKEKRAAELLTANRLYEFISQINHTIVHAKNEQLVFDEACRIATFTGKFDMAIISIPDKRSKKLNLVAHSNATASDLEYFHNLIYADKGPTANVLRSGKLHVINGYENEFAIGGSKKYALLKGFKSCILLPIKKAGKTIGVYNLFSNNLNLFDQREITLLVETASDISFAIEVFEKEKQRKLSEDKVIHSELRLKQAQAIAHIGSWEQDISTGIELWSPEVCRIYGIPEDENNQTFESWVSFIHPKDLDYVMGKVKDAQKKLTNTAFHHRIKRKDGTVRHLYSQSNFEFNENGMPTWKYGVVHDITEAKGAEDSLAQSEANLRQIVDLIPQFIFTRDAEGKYLFVNKSFAALNGLTPNELIKKSINETIPVKSEAGYFLKLDREVISSGKTKTIPEHIFTDYKGIQHLFQSVKVPYTVAGTNEKAVLCINSDITDLKQAEIDRAKMIADIVQRNKDLEQFSYIVSHNLRAPVANIIGLTEILQIPGLPIHDENKWIDNLDISAKKLDGVIIDLNYILQVKHQESKKKEQVRFSSILEDIEVSISNLIRDEQVTIISHFSQVNEMYSIKSYLYSIFFNLVTNSIKYRKHEIGPVIEVTSAMIDGKIQIVFKDNGMGIDLDKKGGQVFGLYKRFHSHVDGKGMGLYMVKTQVESLGGKISIASEVNKGTEFRLEFEAA